MYIRFTILDTCYIALLPSKLFCNLLLGQIQFFTTFTQHIAIEPCERFFIKFLTFSRALLAITSVKVIIYC